MKIPFCLIFSLFILIGTGRAQALVITDSAVTRSVCFNDGTITVAATGGSGNYTFSITGGPTYPNISYPIPLPHQDSVFLTLPHGQYTIQVTDGSGNTALATATVPGTYSFPVISSPPDTVRGTCITLTTLGGLPPYRYAISTVGTNAGFGPYQSSNSFCHLCDGNYWIRVMDSCSNIFTTHEVTVRVPLPQYVISYKTLGRNDSIHIGITAGGAPPYSFHLKNGALSITNNTGIFVTPVMCTPDTFTITDSCGRVIFDSLKIHRLIVTGKSFCQVGVAILKIDSSAIGPFTITGSNGTLTTNQYVTTFSSLPRGVPYHFTITDSCGNTINLTLACTRDTIIFYTKCPFDSSIYMSASSIPFCYPVFLTCLNCIPRQIDTIYGTPARLFTNIQIGVPYSIRIQDQCGFDDTSQYTPAYVPLQIADSMVSCRDFAVYSIPSTFNPPVHYYLYDQGILIDSSTSPRPVFYHLPAGTYQVTATQALCHSKTISVPLPSLGGACMVPMFDSSCTAGYAIFQQVSTSTEKYSLVNTSNFATYAETWPSPYNNTALFYDVPAGSYDLISDSGCTIPFVVPPFPSYTISAYSTRQCTGQALINASYSPQIQSCNTPQSGYFVLLKDNQYIANQTLGQTTSAHFNVSDTGYYVIRLYLQNPTIFGIYQNGDTMCPVDTALVYVDDNPLPNIVAKQVILVCGNVTTNIPYRIFGGTAPYTVQILGYPTRTVNSNRDTFPNVSVGIYTMIVSDSCGISRSFSVSVIDTCSAICTLQSQFSLHDTSICLHSSVSLQNLSSGATHYEWEINGNLYTYATDTSFFATSPGNYTITLYAYIGVCTDSSKRTVSVADTFRSSVIKDTSLCEPFSLFFNTHAANTVWSTGSTDSVLTISTSGLYTAIISNQCGVANDTVNVHAYPGIAGFSLSDLKTSLCENENDSILLTAGIDSTQASVIFKWNTGVSDSSAYQSQIIIRQPGNYQVTADNGFCPQTKSITITQDQCDSNCISGLTVPDIFSPNGDGKNDTFFIPHLCVIDPFVMHIYNRWGELVFESKDINKGWDGKYKGNPEPEEVYWLWLMYALPDKKITYRSGYVTLVR